MTAGWERASARLKPFLSKDLAPGKQPGEGSVFSVAVCEHSTQLSFAAGG